MDWLEGMNPFTNSLPLMGIVNLITRNGVSSRDAISLPLMGIVNLPG